MLQLASRRLRPPFRPFFGRLQARGLATEVNRSCAGMELKIPEILPHFIGGKRVYPKGGAETIAKLYAPTNEVLCQVPIAGSDEVEEAVASSREGYRVWSRMSGQERGVILNQASRLIYDSFPELARWEVLDVGKPLQEALVDMSGPDAVQLFAGHAASFCVSGTHSNLGAAGFYYSAREPLGICVGVGAWNYPVEIACWKSAPALACGNAMIFKPSELTPLTALRIAELYSEAGVPDGVFNVVYGNASTGSLLCEHTAVSKLSLTGSFATGKKIMASAANTLKPITLELGGKSPLVIFEDADIDNAVKASMMANFFCMGEVCSNGTRVFVHNRIKDHFLQKLIDRTQRISVGDPMDEQIQFGALISQTHLEKVQGYVSRAKSKGLNPIYDASTVQGLPDSLKKGNYFGPVIFDDVPSDAEIWTEEIFGPVMCIQGFDNENEVVTKANDTIFGLAAGVFTKDIMRAHRVAGQLDAGTCWINEYNVVPMGFAFGGRKESGFGKENGLEAVHYYSQLKSIYVSTADVWCPYD